MGLSFESIEIWVVRKDPLSFPNQLEKLKSLTCRKVHKGYWIRLMSELHIILKNCVKAFAPLQLVFPKSEFYYDITRCLKIFFRKNAGWTRLNLIMSSSGKPTASIGIYLIVAPRVRQPMSSVTLAFQGPTPAIDVDVDVFAQFFHVGLASTVRMAMRRHPHYHSPGGIGFIVLTSDLQWF